MAVVVLHLQPSIQIVTYYHSTTIIRLLKNYLFQKGFKVMPQQFVDRIQANISLDMINVSIQQNFVKS